MPPLLIDIPPRFRLFVSEQMALQALPSVASYLETILRSHQVWWEADDTPADSPPAPEDEPNWQAAAQAALAEMDARLAGVTVDPERWCWTEVALQLPAELAEHVRIGSVVHEEPPQRFVQRVLEDTWHAHLLERLDLEATASGPTVEMNEEFFADLHRYLDEVAAQAASQTTSQASAQEAGT